MNDKSKPKTHYRRVFKSDHLSVADLEDFIEAGSDLNFTIAHVRQEMNVSVAGRKGNFNIAYFKEQIKPLVLNATNAKSLKQITGSAFIEDWTDIQVNLFIDHSASIGGQTVGGVRINPIRQVRRKVLKKNSPAWGNAIAAYKRDGNLNAVKKHCDIPEQLEKELIAEASGATG